MTAPLFTVKSRLSEFVKCAEEEEPVLITKHGKPTAAIISIDDYNQKFKGMKTRAEILYENWRKSCSGEWDGFDDVDSLRDKWAPPLDAPNPWDEE